AVGVIHGVESSALGSCGDGHDLCSSQNLAEALVLHEIKSALAAIIDIRNKNRPAIGETKLIAPERRNSSRVGGRRMIEVIARVEGGIADKLEDRSVKSVGARAGNNISETRSAAADLCRHPSRTGLQLLHRIHIEIRKG